MKSWLKSKVESIILSEKLQILSEKLQIKFCQCIADIR